MKKLFYVLPLLAWFAAVHTTASAQFNTGNIVVLQVGDGAAALTNTGTALFLKEYNPGTQALISTVIVPITGAARLVQSGTATSEGQITLSQDSTKIIISGYDTTIGVAGVATSTSANIARAIDTVGNAAIVGKADTTKSAFSGNNIRSAARNSGENYWAVGGTTGVYYMGNTATPAVVYSTATNFRVINAANNKLYFSTASGLSRIMRINSQPAGVTVTADTMIVLGTGTTPSPYGIAVNAAETIVYVADDRTSGPGGIQKWVGSGTTWTLAYTLATGTSSGARSLAVDWSGTYPVIYATANTSATAGGTLIKITDSNATAPFLLIATAPTNTAFRSVVFAPKPACITPVLSAAITNYTCGGNGAITLTVTSGTAPTAYSWTGPNGFTASTQNISNLQAGSYVVTATTTGGCSTMQTYVVANNATAVSTTITASGPTTFCQGGSVTLTAPTGTGYTYVWKLNGAVVAGNTTNSLLANASGTYRVIISAGVNCKDSSSTTVTVNPLPTVVIVAGGSTTFCSGGNVQLCAQPSTTVTGFPAGTTFQWTLNGTPMTGVTGACITASAAGTYCVIINNTNGCTASTCQVVTVGAPPTAIVSPAGPLAICQGSSIVLHTNNSPGLTYQWYNGTAAITTNGNDSTYTVTAAGSYTVKVSLSGTCFSTSAAVVVTVNPLPAATITPSSSQSLCVGQSVVLNANTGTGLTYQFTGQTAASTNPTYTFVAPGPGGITVTALVSVTVTNGNGCSATSAPVSITINAKPTATFTTSADTACQMSTIVFTAPAVTGNTYQWYEATFGALPNQTNNILNLATIAAPTNTVFMVRLVVANAAGCTDTSAYKTVVFRPLPTPVISNTNGVLSTLATYAGWQWLQNGNPVPGATLQLFTPTANGSYNVLVTDAFGCSDTAQLGVNVTGLAIHQTPGITEIKVYPNPATDIVHIDAPFAVNIVLRDMQGRIVMSKNAAKVLDISMLADGVYQLIATDAAGHYLETIRVMKTAK